MKLGMNNVKISTKLIFGFAIMLLLILTVVLISNDNTHKILDSAYMIVHTQKVLADLEGIEAELIDLETGQRGFIITGKPQYLEPYNRSMRNVNSHIHDLQVLTSDNISQTKRIDLLKELVDAKLKELSFTIELRHQENGFEKAKEIILTNEGKIIMDEIRTQIEEIKKEELRLLTLRSAAPKELEKSTENIFVVLIIFSVLLSVIIGFLIIRSITVPIKALQNGTMIVGQGNLDHKLGINTKDEIGQLSQSFESMLVKLKRTMASKSVLEEEIETRKQAEEKILKVKLELEKSEAQLIESNKTKDSFFSIIAHDLRNPFLSMIGFSNLLNEKFDNLNVEKQKKYAGLINTSIKNTYELLENLLIWSRSQRDSIDFKPQEENLFLLSNEMIDLLQLSAKKKWITIKNEIPQHILIYADKNMLSTIIRNLLSNAIKFTPEEGEITIGAELQKDDVENTFVQIVVKDNGIGISDDKQAKLFDLGEIEATLGTANEKGTGLGLMLCKEFVEKHEGRIWVESTVGEGSSFYFTLPVASYLMSLK